MVFDNQDEQTPDNNQVAMAEQSDVEDEDIKRDSESCEDDYDCSVMHRLSMLLSDPVYLRPDEAFIVRMAEGKSTLAKDEFRRRFLRFMGAYDPTIDKPN